MRRAARVDANHASIIAALRQIGASVVDTSGLPGFVDVVAGFRGRTVLFEVERPPGPRGGTKGRQLTPDQRQLHATWAGGPLVVVTTAQEAVGALIR